MYGQQGIDHKNITGTIWLVGGLILTNIFWGASGVAVKVAQLQLDTWEIIALRFFVATPLLISFSVAWKGWKVFAVVKKDIPYLVALSIIGIPLEFFLQVTALAHTSATDYTLIYDLSTIFIVFLSFIMIGEKLTKNKIVGSAIAFIGAGLVMTQGSLSFSANISGDIIALIGTVVWALYTVIGKPLNEKYSALTVLNYVFLFGTLELLPFYILGLHASPFELAGATWLSMGFLTICCTLIAFLIYNYGLEKLPASTIGVFMYIGPISGVLLAVLILNESLTLYTALGLVLILFGIYQAERKGISASISK